MKVPPIIEHSEEYFITRAAINHRIGGDALFAMLRERGASGVLMVAFHNGGIRTINFESEKKQLTSDTEQS